MKKACRKCGGWLNALLEGCTTNNHPELSRNKSLGVLRICHAGQNRAYLETVRPVLNAVRDGPNSVDGIGLKSMTKKFGDNKMSDVNHHWNLLES